MTDVENEIKKAVRADGGLNYTARGGDPRMEHFRTVRAKVRGTLIMAHTNLIDRPGGPAAEIAWTEEDDRILDVVSLWLEKVRDRK